MVSNSKKDKISKSNKHRERRSSSSDDRSRSSSPVKSKTSGETTEKLSMSIEETNKLRISMGLRPLDAPSSSGAATTDESAAKPGNSDENFVHKPAEDITEKKRSEKAKEKLETFKEKRVLQSKFLSTPTLAAEPADSASSWVEKIRRNEEEKRKAAERAKFLEEMDEEFGVGNLVQEEKVKQKQKKYGSKDLAGLRVQHAIDEFREGQQVILTLKDKKILEENDDDDADEDVLINVNMADNELAKERAELSKKKTPGYRAYDDDDPVDEFGMLNPNKLLEQYDEKKKTSFRLETGGSYDMSDEKFVDNMKQEIRTRMQSLAMPTPKIASEFYTPEEMDQFKKPKKVTKKKLRSRKMLKADDLLAMDHSESQGTSATHSVALRPAETRRSTAIVSTSKERLTNISLEKVKRELITTTAREDDDLVGPDDDLSNFAIEDEAFDELQSVVNKTMKLNSRKEIESTEKVLSAFIEERAKKLKVEIKNEPMDVGFVTPTDSAAQPVPPDDKSLVLDTMSEFCRNLGETQSNSSSNLPTLRVPKKLKRGNIQTSKKSTNGHTETALDADDELLQHAMENDDFDDDAMDETPAEDVNTKHFRLEESLLSDEPTLDRGIGSALKLAMQKGYIEQDKSRQNMRLVADISAKHITVEDKSSYDIDDKHARRDRYTAGPTSEFKEKEGYKPDVNIEYVDDTGRRMNEKEAFRYLSHRFHGKGSGKKKTEKRAKKILEEETMKKMTSVDTPLQTCNLLKQKQVQLQQPYIVLSGSRAKDSSSFPPGYKSK